jgi:hypothetical protein
VEKERLKKAQERDFSPHLWKLSRLKYFNASFGGTEAHALGKRRLWPGFRQDREGRILMKSQERLIS